MPNNISIRHLRAFRQVADCGSFTRAADSLHVTQSTLTATIKQLEGQVGLTLLDRTTRRVLLTSEGERFLPVAERLLSDFDTALTDLQARAEQQAGELSIAGSPSVLTCILPPLVRDYHRQYDNIAVYLRDDSAGAIEQRVLNNEVDFGIAGNHSNHPDLDYQPLLQDRYGVVFPAEHILAARDQICWQQLKDIEQLSLSSDTGIRAQLSAMNDANVPQQSLIEVSNPAVLAALVEQGLGVSVLPALAAATDSFRQLLFRPIEDPPCFREIHILTRRGRALSPAAEAMRQLVIEGIGKLLLPAHVRKI
ncbi:MAG: LysR family transcriptional regulator [Motiliproteus sp.]|nr:LysR family transcriptional regulator [Motiliproteus sp.]MCW9052734.1 LysR family transcriptional regulator [Motiliproteus sp.]